MTKVYVEVGARKGWDTPFDSYYLGFEPLELSYSPLKERGLNVLQCALGQQAKDVTLYETKHPGCSSLLLPNWKEIRKYDFRQVPAQSLFKEYTLKPYDWANQFEVIREHRVQMRTLDDVCKDKGIDHIDYLKIDVQGTEYDVLRGAQKILERTKRVRLEMEIVPLYEGQVLMDGMISTMYCKGFHLIELFNSVKVRNKETQKLFRVSMDGVFER